MRKSELKGKKLAVIGASYLQLPLVMKARQLSMEVHCFAWEEGAVCREYADFFYPISVVEKERILDKCREVGIEGVMTIASDVAVITVNYVAHHLGLVANPLSSTEITTNKYKMRDCFARHGIPSPSYAIVEGTAPLTLANFQYPVIVKPTDRSGSRGVTLVESATELEAAVLQAQAESFAHQAIIEEYVVGKEVSVESISFEGKHYILQITDKVTTGAPHFVELEHHQPSMLPVSIQEEIKKWVPRALDALQIKNGASHSELKIMQDGQIRFIEIGARMGGDFIGSHLVRLSTGYDFLQGVLEVSMNNFTPPCIKEKHYAGVYFLSAETRRLLPIFEQASSYPEIKEYAVTDPELRDITCSADRSGYLIYQSDKGKFEL